MMSNDEEVAYATIAAVAQAKGGQYSSLLDGGDAGKGDKGGKETEKTIGADARTLAEMLVREEKKVLSDLRMQLMSEVSPRRCTPCSFSAVHTFNAFVRV